MANELKITDVVDQKAITQLQNLKKEIDESYNSYKNFIELLAKGIQDKPSNLQELSSKSANYNKVLNDLITTQNKLADLQKEHETLLQRIVQQTKENVAQILAEARANDLNAAAELKAQKAKTEELKQQKLINQERKKTKYTIEEANEALNQEIKTMRQAEEQNKILRSARKDLDLTTKEGETTVNRFNSVIDRNTAFLKRNSDELVQAKMNVGRYKQDIQSAASEILKGNISLKNMGNLAKSTGGLLKSSMGAGLAEVRIGVGSMIKGMIGAQAIIGSFQKMIGLFKSGVQSIVDFEAANSKLSAILGTTSNDIKDMTADARRLGAATKYTAAEATNLQIELAKLGFSRKEILQSTEGILKFAQATGSDLPEAAALAGAALRMFDAETRETERYVSAMAVATTKSALSFSYLQTAMPIVGPVAKSFNFQIEDTLALLGKLADAGFDASMSATATRNILLNLADGSGKLAKALGGPVNTLPELVAGLKKLREQGVDLNTTLELTDKRSVAAFNAFLTAADKIVPLREQITGVTGELNDMADTMGDNVQGAIAGLSSAWEAFMLSFYGSKGVMKDVLDFFAKGLREVARQLKSNDQLQEDANNQAVANAQKEMNRSNVLEKHRANMARLYKEKINEGMSADQAAVAAKEEYIQAIQSQYEYENTAYQIAIQDRKKAEEDLAKIGLFYFNSSKGLSRKQMQDNVNTAIAAAAGKKAIASISESIIEDLNKIDLKQSQVFDKTKFNKELTEEEKKELEKAAKDLANYQEDIAKRLSETRISLIDDEYEKERATAQKKYEENIASIKGNSEEENKLRANYEEILRNELLAIDKKYLDKIDEEERKRVEDSVKYQLEEKQREYATLAIVSSQNMQKEIDDELERYRQGIISKEQYEKNKTEITQKYALQEAQRAIDLLKEQIEISGLSDEEKFKIKEALAKAEIDLANKVRDAKKKARDEETEDEKKYWEELEASLQHLEYVGNNAVDGLGTLFSGLMSLITKVVRDGKLEIEDLLGSISAISEGLTSIMVGMYDQQIEKIEEQQEKNEEAGEEEIERIEELAESGVISTEEAEARKRAAEVRTKQKHDELEKQKADLEQKQAKWQKANSIIQTTIATSQAIMKALAEAGPFAGPILAAVIGAMGAAQVAIIASQPIPKYAKGTDNHPGGLAIVGDGGRQEVIETDNGAYITPSVPTLVDIPKRAKVIPNLVDYRKMSLHSDALMLDRQMRNNNGEPVIVNVNNDYKNLERKMDMANQSMANLNKTLRKMSRASDMRFIIGKL